MLVPASCYSFSFSASLAPALVRVAVMLSLLKYVLAASPLVLQTAAGPVPELEMRQASDRRGAVASESDICSRVGIDLLEQGGNAADAVSTARRLACQLANTYRWSAQHFAPEWLACITLGLAAEGF